MADAKSVSANTHWGFLRDNRGGKVNEKATSWHVISVAKQRGVFLVSTNHTDSILCDLDYLRLSSMSLILPLEMLESGLLVLPDFLDEDQFLLKARLRIYLYRG